MSYIIGKSGTPICNVYQSTDITDASNELLVPAALSICTTSISTHDSKELFDSVSIYSNIGTTHVTYGSPTSVKLLEQPVN